MSSGIMDLLSTPTTFPLQLDWEGKMEPSSPAQSQQSYAEDQSIIDDDIYDYYKEQLFNDYFLNFDVDLKPNPLELLCGEDVVLSNVSKQEKDPWYDDKLKLSSGQGGAQLGGYAPLPTVVEDAFFELQQEKSSSNAAVPPIITDEVLMEFDSVFAGNVELMSQLTPPQTPPQSSAAFGGGAIPIPQLCVPIQQQQQQQLLQPLYVPLSNAQLSLQQQQQQQQPSFQGTAQEYYIVDEYATMTQLDGVLPQQQQQQQQASVDIGAAASTFNLSSEGTLTPQQLTEVESIFRSLQSSAETYRLNKESQQQQQQQQQQQKQQPQYPDDDDDSCGFSEAGSMESGDSSSSLMSPAARSPVYSDSAESSYYGSRCNNDRDDEDWSPAKTKKLNLSGSGGGGAVTKKRTAGTRPYGRGSEDKKSRKKEQNKNAATRYRQKKKAEIEEILAEENELRKTNDKLKSKSTDLGREIRYLKNLLREMLLAKGLI